MWWRLARLLGWSATFVALAWGFPQLDRLAAGPQPGMNCELEWIDLPGWVTAPGSQPILRDIAATTNLPPSVDIRDPSLCRHIGEGLQGSPWVAEVRRVAKQADGRIRIQATYREPFALVEVGGSAYLVDRAAVRLPVRYAVNQVEDRYWNDWFRIVGVSSSIPREGTTWMGDDLAAGLRLVEFLKEAAARGEVPFRSSLRAVDVANYKLRESGLDGELRIHTIYPGCYINWGLAPGEEYEVEASAHRKLEMLRALYADQGQLPELVLDVRPSKGIRVGKPRRG